MAFHNQNWIVSGLEKLETKHNEAFNIYFRLKNKIALQIFTIPNIYCTVEAINLHWISEANKVFVGISVTESIDLTFDGITHEANWNDESFDNYIISILQEKGF